MSRTRAGLLLTIALAACSSSGNEILDGGQLDATLRADAMAHADAMPAADALPAADAMPAADAEQDSGVWPDATPTPDATPEPDATAADAAEPDVGGADAGAIDAGPVADAGPTCGNGLVEPGETCDDSSGCCNSTCDGFQPSGTTCTTCPDGAHCAGCYAGACTDSRVFCSDLLARGLSTGDGIYAVRPSATTSVAATTSTQAAFCDMSTAGGGWTMVYKKSRLVAGDGAALWYGAATSTSNPAVLNRQLARVDYTNAYQSHDWAAFTQARIEVVTGTVTKKFIEFDLVGSTAANWYSTTRHTSASWTDLPTSPTFDNGTNQAFRIGSGRSFYINRLWGGCPSDRGWLMISTIDACPAWESSSGDPADIIYSKLTTESSIPTAAQTGYADTFVIFLR